MNYEEKYKQTLKMAKEELKVCGSQDCDAARQIFRFFPELKKSNDERIRKEIIGFLKDFEKDHYRSVNFNSWIAWLEKQGEKKNTRKREIDDAYLQGICDAKHEIEKQGEQSNGIIERRKVYADKVIAWLDKNAPKWLYDTVYPIRLDVDAEDLIKQFKKDFGI